jgi:integrase
MTVNKMAYTQERKNKDGQIISYSIRVHRGYDVDGKQLKPYSTTWKVPQGLTPKQIEKALNKEVVAFEKQCENGAAANNTMKLADFCPQYLDVMKTSLSPLTLVFYRSTIERHIIPTLGHLRLKDIKTPHIQRYIQDISELPITKRNGQPDESGAKLSPATIQRYTTPLQSILSLAVKLGIIPENPAKAERLTLPKAVAPKIEFFTKQEAAEMLTALENEDLQFQCLVQIALHIGARRGELTALKFSDVDFKKRKITIQRAAVKEKDKPIQIKPPKDYEIRTVSVNAACLQLISMLKKEKQQEAARLGSAWVGDDWLFTQWNGEIMNPQTPTKQFAKFLKRHGLPHKKFHSLRHSSATLLLFGGVNIKQVQARLGHGDIETTNKYLHAIEEADIEASNVLDLMLNKNPTGKPKISKAKQA